MMHVELIDSAGGDLSIVNSARVSFAKEVEEVSDKDEKLINYLAAHQHMSPFRHNFIQLRCKVPLFLARQLGKHQAGLSWNEESRRYIDDPPEFYIPEYWRMRSEDKKQGSEDGEHILNEDIQEAYQGFMQDIQIYWESLVTRLCVAPEMARFILPQSTLVEFIWSGNLLAFSHVYNLRAGEGAQEEAKQFSKLLDEAISPIFPIGWKALTTSQTEPSDEDDE